MWKAIFPELIGDKQAQMPVMYCSECGGEIYAGEEFYHVGDKACCVDCVRKDANYDTV